MLWRAVAVYFGIVFATAFGFGVLRVLVLTPAVGPLAAVAIEVPVLLTLSWGVAGRVLRRWPLEFGARAMMGGLAFALLMAAEGGLAVVLGQSAVQFLAAMTTPPGALGLAGQIGFAIIPALRRQVIG